MKLSKPVRFVVDVIRDLTRELGRSPYQNEIQIEVLKRNGGEKGCGNDTIIKAKRYLESQNSSLLMLDGGQMEGFGRDVVSLLLERYDAPHSMLLEGMKDYSSKSKQVENISSLFEGVEIDCLSEQQLRELLRNIYKELRHE